MEQPGFIHGKLDIRMLILFLMSRVIAPVDLPTLTDLALCDAGVDYFSFADSLCELVDSGHLLLENDLYSITDKGRQHSTITESSLPYSVRLKAEKALSEVNAKLRRAAQIRSTMEKREDGLFTVRLALDDNESNLFSLSLLAGDEGHCRQIMERFQAAPDHVYNDILSVLLPKESLNYE